ncbi:MAG: ATP-binding protein [Gammaproteobacteria bacterium]
MAEAVLVSWSGGKDSALALHALRERGDYEIVGLLTTVTDAYDRVSIHGVRRDILRAQVAQLGLPLYEIVIPAAASNAIYERAFGATLESIRARAPGIRTIAFGDLFLEDVRAYRERLLTPRGWTAIFPLWGLNTAALADRFVQQGFQAIICCVDTQQMPADWAGRDFDDACLASLPAGVDPCGERGEFHTCVYAGPIFAHALALDRGEHVRRDGRFEYCDLRLRQAND